MRRGEKRARYGRDDLLYYDLLMHNNNKCTRLHTIY